MRDAGSGAGHVREEARQRRRQRAERVSDVEDEVVPGQDPGASGVGSPIWAGGKPAAARWIASVTPTRLTAAERTNAVT
jgi:hypothetical protein